ncbi:oligosaccharide flippase family protein [Candidatus Uhrbacteria bacterium]|nr:oligosaccharide flippase family protein [Candidatus Uhrbacteria bacterium]
MQHIPADSARKNAAYLLITEGGTKALSLLSFVIMARGLTPQSYGVIALAFSVGSIFFIFFNLGLEHHLIRAIRHARDVGDDDAPRELLSAVATLKVWILLPFVGALVLLAELMQWERSYLPTLFALFFYFYFVSAMQVVLAFFRAFEKMQYECVIRVLQAMVLLGVSLWFGCLHPHATYLALGYATIAGVSLLGVLLFFTRTTMLIPTVGHWMRVREIALLRNVKYLFLTGVATSIFSGVDVLIISKMRSIEEVAVYKNAVMITLALFMVPTAIVQGFFPRLVQPMTQLDTFLRQTHRLLSRLVPMGMVIAGGCFFAAPFIIPFLFGVRYIAAVDLFRFSLLAFVFATADQVYGYGMIALGAYRAYFMVTLLTSMLSIPLNVLLISRFGLMGGIWTMNVVHLLLIVFPVTYLYVMRARARGMPSSGT